jgi:hypothetical protein
MPHLVQTMRGQNSRTRTSRGYWITRQGGGKRRGGSVIRARCAPLILRRPVRPYERPSQGERPLKPFLRRPRRRAFRSTLPRQAGQVPPHLLGARHRKLTNPTTHRQNSPSFPSAMAAAYLAPRRDHRRAVDNGR